MCREQLSTLQPFLIGAEDPRRWSLNPYFSGRLRRSNAEILPEKRFSFTG
jgi:hypothetical protein